MQMYSQACLQSYLNFSLSLLIIQLLLVAIITNPAGLIKLVN